MAWDLVVVLAAAALPRAVDAGDTAVVPHGDQRYQELMASHPAIRRFLESFRTPFGIQLQPSVVIRDSGAPRIIASDLAALRDILALTSVIRARKDRCVHRFGGQGPVYADLFEIYPVNLAIDREMVVVQTASEVGLDDDLEQFQGQTHPAYVYPENVRPEFDETLLTALLELWKQTGAPDDTFRRRVFRSMEFAYHALASPFRHLGSEQDHALALSLWVSAFEVLANQRGRVRVKDVERLISAVPWRTEELLRDCVESVRGPRPGQPVTRPVQTYERLYKVRNQSLHGGAVDTTFIAAQFAVPPHDDGVRATRLDAREWNHLAVAVPALYRGVLLQLLRNNGFCDDGAGRDDILRNEPHLDAEHMHRDYEKPLVAKCHRQR